MKKAKKVVIIDREKFIESVYHIVYYGNLLENLKNTFMSVVEKISKEENLIFRLSIQWNVMIIANSLMDELNKYLFKYNAEEESEKHRISSYRYICEPIIKEMDSWSDLRNFRNHVLAHNFRKDKNNFSSVLLKDELKYYIIPNRASELIALFKYLNCLTGVARELFSSEYDEAVSIVDSFDSKVEVKGPHFEKLFERVDLLVLEVNRRIAEYNK